MPLCIALALTHQSFVGSKHWLNRNHSPCIASCANSLRELALIRASGDAAGLKRWTSMPAALRDLLILFFTSEPKLTISHIFFLIVESAIAASHILETKPSKPNCAVQFRFRFAFAGLARLSLISGGETGPCQLGPNHANLDQSTKHLFYKVFE
jgi:hypothetical protein